MKRAKQNNHNKRHILTQSSAQHIAQGLHTWTHKKLMWIEFNCYCYWIESDRMDECIVYGMAWHVCACVCVFVCVNETETEHQIQRTANIISNNNTTENRLTFSNHVFRILVWEKAFERPVVLRAIARFFAFSFEFIAISCRKFRKQINQFKIIYNSQRKWKQKLNRKKKNEFSWNYDDDEWMNIVCVCEFEVLFKEFRFANKTKWNLILGDLFGKCHDSISINEQLNRHQRMWNFWWSGNVSKSI